MPVLEVSDMARSVLFYRDILGFKTSMFGDPATFTIVQRDAITIALDASRRGQTSNNQYWAAYLYVSNVEQVYSEFRQRSVPIHRDIQNTDYGLRDFDIVDPDGYILAFGQPLNIGPDDLGPGLGPLSTTPDRRIDASTTESAS